MIDDWDKAYENGAYIDGADGYVTKWQSDAAAFRETLLGEGRVELDLAYGAGERQKLDMFLPEGAPKGLAMFVHGGYWKAFDKSYWSHLAAGALAQGWVVVLPSYTLAPVARISAITQEIATALTFVARRIDGPIRLAGHSAGGHLVTRMLCANDPLESAICDRIAHVVSISGVHDLRPLTRTKMNDVLMLDAEEAVGESPVLRRPKDGASLTCWVGADERPEFLRQNDLLANIWIGLGANTQSHHAQGHHHFSVIGELADPESALTQHFVG